MKKLTFLIVCSVLLQTNSFSQNWDTLANIPVGLAFPVVVALNGEIHVIGGGASTGASQIHLRYKPTTNIWDTLADVPYHAQQPAGAVLNGKIHYFGGGFPNSGTPLSAHYVYDPGTDTWASAASLPIPRVIMEAAAINGKLYALSGQPDRTRVDEYDPGTDTWTSKNPLPDMNFWYSAIVVRFNEIYRFGGGGFSVPVANVDKYNAGTDSWTNIATLPQALHAPAGTELGGLIYVAGGYNAGDIDVTQTFDVNTLTFTTVNPLPVGRSYHELVTIDTCIYSVGGDNSLSTSLLRYCNPAHVRIKEINSETSISVFPNPAIDKITINSGVIFNSVELADITGKILFKQNVSSLSTEIDLSKLNSGMYFLSVYTKGKIVHQKIVKE